MLSKKYFCVLVLLMMLCVFASGGCGGGGGGSDNSFSDGNGNNNNNNNNNDNGSDNNVNWNDFPVEISGTWTIESGQAVLSLDNDSVTLTYAPGRIGELGIEITKNDNIITVIMQAYIL